MKRFNLEERMIEFASAIIHMVNDLPNIFAARHLGKQLIRSATSVALNYGEGQVAESRADFIHKLKIAVKELKESSMCLHIMARQEYLPQASFATLIKVANELIAILIISIKTAKNNSQKK